MNHFTDEMIQYAEDFTSGESPVLYELRRHCYEHYEDSAMLSGFVQGRVLAMFSQMIRPQVVLEIGTYLGYSALCFAEGLEDGGKVITLDVNEETNKVARSFVEKSEFADKVEFHLGSALGSSPSCPRCSISSLSTPISLIIPTITTWSSKASHPAALSSPTTFSGRPRARRRKGRERRGAPRFNQMVMAASRLERPVPDPRRLMVVRKN